jgi:hypothetical protein
VNAALRRAALAAVAVAVLPLAAWAQGDVPVGGVRFLSGFEARSVSFDSGLGLKSATEYAVPLGVMWTASPRLAFDFGVRYASVARTPDRAGQAKATITGLTDAQLRGVFQVVPDVVVLTVSTNLPTGKTKLTADELLAAGVAASELIPFPVANFGSGANVTAGLAVAVPVAGWAVGVGGSYRLTSGYTPFARAASMLTAADSVTIKSYKPGGELRVRVGADRVVGQGRISLGFTLSSFAEDEFGGSRLFQPGKRYITQGSWSFPVGNLGLALYAWDLYRNAGTVAASSLSTEKQNVLTGGVLASIQIGRNVLRPQIEYRLQSIQSAGTSKLSTAGHLLSFSARYQLSLGERYALLPAVRFDTGNQIYGGATFSFTGWGLSMGLRATL